ncbi:GGDEF domain-containing protein [Piscinibacter terrae]|uniref:GGDEF domain-containing protein n=1 Tax=Piscinibacter terrae TaxID=2496871 RepID=UPI001387475C|nr:GGDEF domain-containing protein [Albitalea terrae]
MPQFSATEIAYLMVGCQQAVLAFGWLAAAGLLPQSRKSMLAWALHATLSAVALCGFVVATRPGNEPLRAAANLSIVGSMIALQWGVRVFVHRESAWRWHAGAAALAALVSWYGLDPAHGAVRVAVISGLLAVLTLATAWDLQRAARWKLDWRWRLLLSVPVGLAGLVFAARSLRAALDPEHVVAYVTANSTLNTSSAVIYLVVALAFQLTLVALVVSQFVTELKEASRFDSLTGALNRRAIDEVLNAEVMRSRRLKDRFSVLMIDVDHFKDINDRHGHAAGDRALQHLGTVFTTHMREIDRVGRYGGEEFVVVLPGASIAEARQMADRLRERVEASPLRWQERAVPLTISVGLSHWQGDEDQLATMMARADAALYRAKQGGRNRVMTSELMAVDVA